MVNCTDYHSTLRYWSPVYQTAYGYLYLSSFQASLGTVDLLLQRLIVSILKYGPFFKNLFVLCFSFSEDTATVRGLALIHFHGINLALVPWGVMYGTGRRKKTTQSRSRYRPRVSCSIWPRRVRQTRVDLSKDVEKNPRAARAVCIFLPFLTSFWIKPSSDVIYSLLPIKRDYSLINIVYVVKSITDLSFHFLLESHFTVWWDTFLEEYKGKSFHVII